MVYLPHTYLPGDNKRVVAERVPSRIEENLPETGFVFVCFNDPYKVGPETFEVWMRLLRAVEGSVLWLRCTNIAMMHNTRREADVRQIAAEKLVFAPRQAPAQILRGTGSAIFFSIPCRTMRTRRRATHFGRGCRL